MDALVSHGDFYVTLPSNASMDLYPENVLSQFTVQLNTSLRLTEAQWEVALVEMMYPSPTMSAFQLADGEFPHVHFSFESQGIRIDDKIMVPTGIYSNGQQLVSAINAMLDKRQQEALKAEFDQDSGRIKFTNRRLQHIEFKFPGRAALLLGFQPDKIYPVTGSELVAPNSIDLSAGINLFYVYSNICKPQPVGDKLVPLLRVVPHSNSSAAQFVKNLRVLITSLQGDKNFRRSRLIYLQTQVPKEYHFLRKGKSL